MSKIRDIIGMCFEQGLKYEEQDYLDYSKHVISYSGVEKFEGSLSECLIYLQGYKDGNKKDNQADLLEKICRANIQGLNEWEDFDGAKAVAQNWKKELEAVYLSDDEVNEREKRNG